MKRPTDHQQAVADACKATSVAKVAREFGISAGRVNQICRDVLDYDAWKAASDANELLPAEQRLIRLLPLSPKAVNNLTYEGYTTVGELASLSLSQLIAIPGTGKTTANEIKAYLTRHMPTGDGVMERLAWCLALQHRRRDDVRPANHPGVADWVDRNWPDCVKDARAVLANLRKLPIVIAERAASAAPGMDADAVARIWRTTLNAIEAR